MCEIKIRGRIFEGPTNNPELLLKIYKLTYGYNSDCSIKQKHEKLIITLLREMELLLLLDVEVVDVCVVVDGEGSSSGRSHGTGKG